MGLLDLVHAILDYVMTWVHLAQNGQVGWKSFNRKTGRDEREQIPPLKKLKLILLFNPLMEWLDSTHLMRVYMHDKSTKEGKIESTARSKEKIKGFVDTYHINMNDFEPSDINAYSTFKDFFARHHTSESRPIAEKDNSRRAVVVADSRIVVYDTVSETTKLWIKGSDFSITNLVMDTDLGAVFADGAVASFRLSPQDYHRYHSPVTGRIKQYRSIPGDYYQVDPIALKSKVNILTSNARDFVLIETEDFGDVLFVAIGATNVGKVEINAKFRKPGNKIAKGDELGLFQFGASSIIVAFHKGRIKFDDDLTRLSKECIQVSVEVGMSLGIAANH